MSVKSSDCHSCVEYDSKTPKLNFFIVALAESISASASVGRPVATLCITACGPRYILRAVAIRETLGGGG
jgi:hypothetical protein